MRNSCALGESSDDLDGGDLLRLDSVKDLSEWEVNEKSVALHSDRIAPPSHPS